MGRILKAHGQQSKFCFGMHSLHPSIVAAKGCEPDLSFLISQPLGMRKRIVENVSLHYSKLGEGRLGSNGLRQEAQVEENVPIKRGR